MERVKAVEILMPGPLTTVQDRGRFGFGCYGVPPSGAIDTFSLRMANLLAGNPESEPCIEITLMGLKARFLTDLVFAVTGGDLQPFLNERPLPMWQAHSAAVGDLLSFKGPGRGCRAYLALAGGISVESVLGSKSTNLSSGFGGMEGRPLRKGDLLYTHAQGPRRGRAPSSLQEDWIPCYGEEWSLRVLPGPQREEFPQASWESFLSSTYTVTQQSDRTGIRLSGPPVHRANTLPESIISEGVVPGAIQVPGDAQPIILLVETVTGGYRKIAVVISADLPLLGQVKPGDRVRFRQVSMETALEAMEKTESIFRALAQGRT